MRLDEILVIESPLCVRHATGSHQDGDIDFRDALLADIVVLAGTVSVLLMKRICLVTSAHLSYNPRALKEADALHATGFTVRVVAMNVQAEKCTYDQALMAGRTWKLETVNVRKDSITGRWCWLRSALRQRFYELNPQLMRMPGGLEKAYSRFVVELACLAAREQADLYIAHNLPALPAAAKAAAIWGAKLGFDAEDFHRGELVPSAVSSELIRRTAAIEDRYIPRCHHLTAASEGIGKKYVELLHVPPPAVVLNAFPLSERNTRISSEDLAQERRGDGLSLYWFSQVIGPDRGLEDVIQAISLLRGRVQLNLRGQWATGYEDQFRRRIYELWIQDRVHIHPPTQPRELVQRASQHDVGLALEPGNRENNTLATSNKLLVYLLAGLAVAVSDVPGQMEIMQQTSGAGFSYPRGSSEALACGLQQWIEHPTLLAEAKAAARRAAESRFCWDVESARLVAVVSKLFEQ